MEIKEIQDKIMDFAQKRAKDKGFELTPELSYIHLTEELGEVARILSDKKIRPDKFNPEDFKEEIADVILESLILAKLCNIDIDKAMQDKINTLLKRHGYK